MTKGAYDLEANLALLRFYQYAPATAKIPVVCKVSFLQLAAACCRFAHSLPFPPSLTISSTPPSLSIANTTLSTIPLPLPPPALPSKGFRGGAALGCRRCRAARNSRRPVSLA